MARRRALVPAVTYPEDLPVVERRDEIAAAIRDHQVVIVAGETGSGKTTQLPKICLELGRGVDGPDRPHPAAPASPPARSPSGSPRSSAPSSASAVGYKVRFTDQVGDRTRCVKVMTDGILLAEIQRDRELRALRHDHHRRGARAQPQHRLPARLPQAAAAAAARPEGDHHLGDDRHRAVRRALRRRAGHRGVRPHVPGRGALPAARRGRRGRPRPDARRIVRRRRRADGARARATSWSSCPASARSATPPTRSTPPSTCRDTEVLPLYARLSAAEQHRVFAPHTRPADRAGHQRGRDLADRARHPLRGRPRHRARSPATASAPRCSGCRSSRSRRPAPTSARAAAAASRRRHLHPAVLRGGLRRPAGVHRAGDPAHQPGLGHPADDRRSGSATSRAFPFVEPPDRRQITDGVRAARGAAARSTIGADGRKRLTAARPQAGPAAGRPAAGPDGARGRRQRLRCARSWSSRGAVDPGPARAARWTSSSRPTSSTAGSPTTDSDFLALPQPVALPAGAAARAVRQRVPPACARPSSCTTCGSASGRTCTASCARWRKALGISCNARRRPTPTAGATSRCWPACCRTSACATPEKREYLGARDARFAHLARAPRCSRSRRSG